jgi:hypothetical protein
MLAIVAGSPTPMPTPSAITLDSVKPFEGGGLFDNGFPVLVARTRDVEGLDVGSPVEFEIEVEVGFNEEGPGDAVG